MKSCMKLAKNEPPQNQVRQTLLPVVAAWCAVLAAAFVGGPALRAQQTFNWNVASGYYTNGSAWDLGSLPGILDTAVVGNGGTVLYTDTMTNDLASLLMGDTNSGTFTMSGGELDITNSGTAAFHLGNADGSTANFTMNGGTLTVARPSNGNGYYQDSFYPDTGAGSSGTFTLNDGTVNILCGMEAGIHGVGTLTVNGGTLIANGWFTFGRGTGSANTDGSGIFNLTGGTVYQLRNSHTGTDGLRLQQNGTNGEANISGGALYTLGISLGISGTGVPHPTATLNVSGGDLYIGYHGLNASASHGQIFSVNLSGGTFHTLDIVNDFTLGTNEFLADGTNWTWNAGDFPPINLTTSPGPGTVTFAPEDGRTITLNAPFTGPGALTVAGPGTVVLGAAESYTGGTAVTGGTLALAAPQTNSLGLTLSSGATLALNNNGALVESPLTIGAGATLDFNAGNVTETFTNDVSGAGGVLVTLGASGVEIATGNLGLSGSTVVRSGTLEVDGALNNSSGVVVSNGAALGGAGSIAAPISLHGNAVLYTGTAGAPGTLSAGDVTLGDTATLAVRIGSDTTPGGGTNDLLEAHNLTLAPASTLNINAFAPPSLGTYVLAKCSGTLTGTFGTVNGPRGATVTYTGNEVDLVVNSTNVTTLAWNAPIGAANIAWDVNTSSNWLNTGTSLPAAFHQFDAVTFNSAPGTTNRVSVSDVVNPSSITITGGVPYLFSGLGYITGGTGITYDDTNTSGIYTSGNDYTGPVHINAGVLQLGIGGSQWLGATNGATYVNGGSLDLNGQDVGSEPLVIQGAGANGQGALISSRGDTVNNGNLTLSGDAAIGGTAGWNFVNGVLNGNGFKLTKLGDIVNNINGDGDTGLGDVDVAAGRLIFQGNVTLGLPGDTLTVETNATVTLYSLTAPVEKQLVLSDNATLDSGGASNELDGPVTLAGNGTIQTRSDLRLTGGIGGTGNLTKINGNTLWLDGTNTYSGATLINAGGIVLEANAVLGPTSPIDLASGAFLDASAAGGLTLSNSQTLSGFGGVAGDVTAGAGSMIAPGTITTAGTLTFSNNLTFNGATNVIKLGNDPSTTGGGVNDLIMDNGNLTFSGTSTIEINPIGVLDTSMPYTIMQYNGTLTGGAANLHVVSDNPGYTVSLVDPTTTAGYIEVNVTGSPANLLWQGTAASNPNAWDHVDTNWLNLGTATSAAYNPGDNTIFDDTGSTKTVNVATTAIGSMTLSNTAAYTFTGGGLLGGILDVEGTGATTLAVSNPPTFSAIMANYGTLVFDVQGVDTYSNNATISDNGGGLATLVKAGTNTMFLGADNSAFNGTIVINNGVLQYHSSASLGYAGGYLYATNHGTLDLHGTSSGPKNINIAGSGFNGQGALVNTGGALVNQNGIYYLNFVGDATIGGTGRFDIYNNTINGNGFNVTKIGTSALFFSGDGETYLGNLDIKDGRIGFQSDITMGDPTKTVTIETNAALTFYSLTNSSSPNGGVDKIAVLQGDGDPTNGFAVLDSGGNGNNFNGPVTLVGTNNILGVRSDLRLWSGVSGSGGFIVSGDYYAGSSHFKGNGTLYLEGTNTYTGPTIISNNAVVVGTNSSLGDSSLIQVNGGTHLDVSALPSFDLGAGQTLIGAGTVSGNNIVFGSGATLAAGFPDANAYTLTMNGSLTLQSGSTNVVVVNNGANDTVGGLTSVQMGGTLVVNNVGSPLAGGDAIKLFSATSYSGGFDAIIPATPGPSLTWDTSQLDSNGTLLVAGTGVSRTPTNIVFSVSGHQLTLSWPTNHIGWTLQVQTNDLSVGISTNWVKVSGSETTNKIVMPIDPANGTVFYRMILTNP